MAEMQAIQRYLRSFAIFVRKEAKANVKGTQLEKSIKFRVVQTPLGWEVEFRMAQYGQFVDKGVSGNTIKREYTNYDGDRKESPYSFTNKQPPPDILAKWISKKKIKGRDPKTGRYISNMSLAYVIGRSIKSKGLRSLSFFQEPLGTAMEAFGLNMMNAVKEDIITGWTTFKN